MPLMEDASRSGHNIRPNTMIQAVVVLKNLTVRRAGGWLGDGIMSSSPPPPRRERVRYPSPVAAPSHRRSPRGALVL